MTAYSRRFWYLVSAEMLAAALFSDGMSHDVGRQERDVRRGTSGERHRRVGRPPPCWAKVAAWLREVYLPLR
jgi:hypothetical protein